MQICHWKFFRAIGNISYQYFGDRSFLNNALQDINKDNDEDYGIPLLVDLSGSRKAESIRVRTVLIKETEPAIVYQLP